MRDYNEKLEECTQIETLQAYLLIAQDVPKIEVFRRHEADKWLYEYATGLESEISLPLLGKELQLSLAQIYRRVQRDVKETSPDEGEKGEE